MCMGGGSAATITVPDYKQYDQQFDLQKAAIEQAANQSTLTAQADLNSALREQQTAATELLIASLRLSAELVV